MAVLELLAAHVRERAPRPPGTPAPDAGARPEEDVQAVLAVIEQGRWAEQVGEGEDLGLECLDLSRTRLRGARLGGAPRVSLCLQGADLWDADLREANLREAKLGEAYLADADLRGATLAGADLRGADLEEADLRGVGLAGIDLAGAELTDVEGLTQAQLDAVTWCGEPPRLPPGLRLPPDPVPPPDCEVGAATPRAG